MFWDHDSTEKIEAKDVVGFKSVRLFDSPVD